MTHCSSSWRRVALVLLALDLGAGGLMVGRLPFFPVSVFGALMLPIVLGLAWMGYQAPGLRGSPRPGVRRLARVLSPGAAAVQLGALVVMAWGARL